jgi:hypothetical protein
VFRFNDEMGDNPRDRVDDHPANLAALTVTAADFSTDRELRQ